MRHFWLFVATAIVCALLPLVWYVPHLRNEPPALVGRVVSVSDTELEIRFKKETMTVLVTAGTMPPVNSSLVGKRVLIQLDPVKDGRKEVIRYRVLEQ